MTDLSTENSFPAAPVSAKRFVFAGSIGHIDEDDDELWADGSTKAAGIDDDPVIGRLGV